MGDLFQQLKIDESPTWAEKGMIQDKMALGLTVVP